MSFSTLKAKDAKPSAPESSLQRLRKLLLQPVHQGLRLMLIALVAVSCALPSRAPAETDFNQVGSAVATLLANRHFSRTRFDADFDKQFMVYLTERLDPTRMYLLESDVEWMKTEFGRSLHESVLDKRTMEVAIPIYERLEERTTERLDWVQKRLAQGEFNLSNPEEFFETNREAAAWPKTQADADALWEKRLLNEVIIETLRRDLLAKRKLDKGEEVKEPDESVTEKLAKRYQRMAKDRETLNHEDIASEFLSQLASFFDPHTDYMSFAEEQNFQNSMDGKLKGIGALLSSEDDGTTRIRGIVVGGPADRQGELQIDDRIIAVDSLNTGEFVDTVYMRIDRVVELVRGEEGTEVALKVIPANAPDEEKEIVIVRGEVELKDQKASAYLYDLKQEDGSTLRLGWIEIPSFYASFNRREKSSVTADVEKLLRRLQAENIDGLIVDLRANGGGVLSEAVDLTGLFIPRGPVVQVGNHFGRLEQLRSSNAKPLYEGPLMVLTSRMSASASEILAGALQDYDRALIVGDDRTFGKGTVQRVLGVGSLMPLFSDRERAGLIKVTEQKFYRPSGTSTQLEGVKSDLMIPSLFTAFDIGEESEYNPLPHDELAAAKFSQMGQVAAYLPALKKLSSERIAQSSEFDYVIDDVKRAKEEQERTKVVLDLESRKALRLKQEEERKERELMREEVIAQLAKRDEKNLQAWRITLDNVDDRKLNPLTDDDDQSNMRQGEQDEDSLISTPEYPNGLEPLEREAMSILQDLIRLPADAVQPEQVVVDEAA